MLKAVHSPLADAGLTLEDLLPCALTPTLPLTIVNVFTWPEPAARFTYDADPMETGGDLKAKLAAHIGYLALDVLVRKGCGTELLEAQPLSAQGLMPGDEVRIVRRSKLPQGAGAGGQDECALAPSSASLERLPQSAFALSCLEDYPKKPVLLRMLQLNHGMLPDLRAPCALQGCAPAPELASLLVRMGALPERHAQGTDATALVAADAAAKAAAGGPSAKVAPAVAAAAAAIAREGPGQGRYSESADACVDDAPHSTLAELAGIPLRSKRSDSLKLDDIFDTLIDWDGVAPPLRAGGEMGSNDESGAFDCGPSPSKRSRPNGTEARAVKQEAGVSRTCTRDTVGSVSSETGDDRDSNSDTAPSEEAVPSGAWPMSGAFSAGIDGLDLSFE